MSDNTTQGSSALDEDGKPPSEATEEERASPGASGADASEDATTVATNVGAEDPDRMDADEASDGEETVETLRESLAGLRAELDAARDQALRAQAEAENTRRRASRETENARKFALERFVSALLPPIDSFERAVAAATASGAEPSVVEGIELSLKLLVGVLEGEGVRVVDPAGEPFDPQFHEAMSMVAEPDMEPGSVARVIQKGYVLNERLVRAAMVMVVQPPPAAEASNESDAKA